MSGGKGQQLEEIIQREAPRSRRVKHAKILLESELGKSAAKVADWVGVGHSTVERTRQRYAAGGLGAALKDKPRPGGKPKLDGKQQAFIMALACSDAPEGQERWSMQMLADKIVELGIVEERVSHDTIGRVLKNELNPWHKEQWCIAKVGADFVWRMEDVLEEYALPYAPKRPQVCVDERPCQLLKDNREPLPVQSGQPRRYDYEYERQGICTLFMVFQPLMAWRHITVTAHRKKEDFAYLMRDLVDVHFPEADLISVVLDNLNIHSPASLYATFEPPEARRILHKLEFHFTPKHGSWLNIVEIELSILVRQCLGQRLPDVPSLRHEVSAWQLPRNTQKATVRWQFSVENARTKLKHLYPSLPVR